MGSGKIPHVGARGRVLPGGMSAWAALLVLTGSIGMPACAPGVGGRSPRAAASTPMADEEEANRRGFDFELGRWRVHHRVKRPDGSWSTFEGTCTTTPVLGGAGNVEDHEFRRPTGVTRGLALRSYDPATRSWAIWWVDSRVPHGRMDPPMIGRFRGGVGTFFSDGVVDGVPTRTRFVWSHITATSARWEQATSTDGGTTWEPNWVMALTRADTPGASSPASSDVAANRGRAVVAYTP